MLTGAAALLIVAAVVLSLRVEERFVVEQPRLVRDAEGVRVAATVRNAGEAAWRVEAEVTLVGAQGGGVETEVVALGDLAAGASAAFATRPRATEIRRFSVRVSEGRNPYGN